MKYIKSLFPFNYHNARILSCEENEASSVNLNKNLLFGGFFLYLFIVQISDDLIMVTWSLNIANKQSINSVIPHSLTLAISYLCWTLLKVGDVSGYLTQELLHHINYPLN